MNRLHLIYLGIGLGVAALIVGAANLGVTVAALIVGAANLGVTVADVTGMLNLIGEK